MSSQSETRWPESESALKQILPADSVDEFDIRIERTRSKKNRRKILLSRGGRKYICQLALRRAFLDDLKGMHDLARAHSVPLARVLSEGTYLECAAPVHYLVLDWMPGTTTEEVGPLTLHQLADLGRIFGHLHSIGSDQWGVPGATYPTRFNDVETMRRWWFSCIEDLNALKEAGPVDAIARSSARFYRDNAFMRSLARRSLVHGDPHGNNIVVEGDQFFLIDTDQMKFDFAPFELFHCLLSSYNEVDLERQSAFLLGYQEVVDPALWRLWEEHTTAIAATAFLIDAKTRLEHWRLFNRRGKRSSKFKRAMCSWKTFAALTAEPPAQQGDLKSVMAIFHEVLREAGIQG